MKGKTNSIYKIFILMAVIVSAVLCVNLSVDKPHYVLAAGTEAGGDTFSSVDSNMVIMSVEKVGVASNKDFTKELFYKTDQVAGSTNYVYSNMLGSNNTPYYYTDYYKDTDKNSTGKYVVHRGEYVMLENSYTSGIGYHNNKFDAYKSNSSQEVEIQEAIMVSFGQYVYNPNTGTVEHANDDTWANITYLSVSASRNNIRIDNLPGVRVSDDGNYKDFVYIITQEPGNEGFYNFTFSYMYNGTSYEMSFSFYILYQTTYKGDVEHGSNKYSIQPTLSIKSDWPAPWTHSEDHIYHYTLGCNDYTLNYIVQYPMLTFDYTKYDLNYTHTANGVVITYDYKYLGNGKMEVVKKSASGGTSTFTYTMEYYKEDNINNNVTLIFTEMGTYTFEFKYIYTGWVIPGTTAPQINIPVESMQMMIHGMELKYSKAGYREAQMRHLTFARGSNSGDPVDLIIPNGYMKDSTPSDTTLGIVYTLDTSEANAKVGSVIDVEEASITDFTQFSEEELANYNYTITNQGSLWLSTNDSFNTENSYYYYSTTPITKDMINDDNKLPFTNNTSFKRVGYYLVAVQVNANNYIKENIPVSFMQYFEFQYRSNTLTMEVEDSSGRIIGSGEYTNKSVTVDWEPATTFERNITAKYYTVHNQFYDKQKLLTYNGTPFNRGATFGNQGSYLIELKSEGATTTYRMFTIDTTPISGVRAYAVDSVYFNNEKVYSIKINSSGNPITIDNSITNDLATLYWDDKASGANIKVEYTFTPFVKDTSIDIGLKRYTAEDWINTNYTLGDTIGGFELEKPASINGGIDYQHVLYNQGIYVFTLTDDAGNSCKYLFIIDNTEAYFKIDDTFITNTSYISNTNIAVEIGTHKVINMTSLLVDTDINNRKYELSRIANGIVYNDYKDLNSLGYYQGEYNNIEALRNLLTIDNDHFVLKVANRSLTAYRSNTGTLKDSESSIEKVAKNESTVNIKKPKGEQSNSVVKRLYILGANQTDTKVSESKSYVLVEINTDNARGMVFSTNNDNLTIANIESKINNENSISTLYRRFTGNTVAKAGATSDKYLAFTWNVGSEQFEVVKVELQYYKFSNSIDSKVEIDDVEYYYYDSTTAGEPTILYDKNLGIQHSSVTFNGNISRGMAMINVANRQTVAGLYAITRYYDWGGDIADEYDSEKLTYYIIVDRNGIIVTDTVNGGNINIGLLDNESDSNYNNFNTIGGLSGRFSSDDDEFINQQYNIYLNTNKVPAIFNVPLYKYFYTESIASNYDAGSLDIKLYYKDTFQQLNRSAGTTLKLYDSTSDRYIHTTSTNGYYSFSIIDNIKEIYPEYINNFTNNDRIKNGSYICLQGDYILVIRDRVTNNNLLYSSQKIIGLRIQAQSPNVDIYSVINKDDGFDLKQDAILAQDSVLTLTTSDEFVKINLNEYISGQNYAQIDPNYLVVYNETTQSYFIEYEYSHRDGYDLRIDGDYVQNVNSDGIARIITLDTGLRRNEEGKIDLSQNIDTPYVYTIKVRFRLSHDGKGATYADCYYKINIPLTGSEEYISYYEKEYKVVIDRKAPTNNVKNISSTSNDKLLEYYDKQMEDYVYGSDSDLYYVNRYKKYYENGISNNADIYAFLVNADTPFDHSEIDRFFYRPYNIQSDRLSLPITNYTIYTEIKNFRANTYYGAIGSYVSYNGYYEIIEQDKAGNVCQYVIYYVENTTDIEASDLILTLTEGIISNNGVVTVDYTNPYEFSENSYNPIFKIGKINVSGTITDKFYRIELWSNNTLKGSINTNATTTFDETHLGEDIVVMINNAGLGNYLLKVISRNDQVNYRINFMDNNNIKDLNIDSLVYKNILTFGAANIFTSSGTNKYYSNYASVVTLTYTKSSGETVNEKYTVVTDSAVADENYKYYLGPNGLRESVNLSLIDTSNGTLIISIEDPFGTKYLPKRINLNGQLFESIKIGEYVGSGSDRTFVERNYHQEGNAYYTYHSALVEYDTTIYELNLEDLRLDQISILRDNAKLNQIIERGSANGFEYLLIKGYLANNNHGGLIEATIKLKYKATGMVEREYRVIIDTLTGNVMLRDTSNNEQSLKVDVNVDYNKTAFSSTCTGTMNLTWTKVNNDYFIYEYILHEFMDNGSVDSKIMTTNNAIIYTELGSMGKYVFEIKIYNKDSQYIGNKLYTFSVQAMLNQLYYFQNSDGMAVGANSTFYFYENGNWTLTTTPINSVKTDLGLNNTESLTSNEVPLYIYNQELTIAVSTEQGATSLKFSQKIETNNLTIYRVFTNTYSIYVATLYVPMTTQILDLSILDLDYDDTVRLLENDFKVDENLYYSVYSANKIKDTTGSNVSSTEYLPMGAVALKFNSYIYGANNYLTKKNIITLEVYHNDKYVGLFDDFEVGISDNIARLTILGSGKFTFIFKDLAGNIHTFVTNSGFTQESINITVVREMILTVNNEVPVDNGFYNDDVVISVYNASMYDLASIKLKSATLNGEPYTPRKSYYNYTFSDYGTYRVTFEADYKGVTVSKTIVFTRVNVREAREAIDLSSIGNYEITNVTNMNNEDVTHEFLSLIYNNAVTNGMYVTYDRLVENSDDLGVTTGKQTFTITYIVHDKMYPSRKVSFAFTLNNEQPTIECSVGKGETTTKGFTLKLNGGIIYEQIGEALLYINDQLFMYINENTPTSVKEFSINRKDYGSGEYFVRLVSTSGNVIDSYKIVIKDPLNASAVIVIVILVAIVVGIALAMIILRRRMRIR